MGKNDSYQEIGFFRPKFNKYLRVGWNPSYWFYRLRWYLTRRLHYKTRFPIHMDIESTNFCNMRCIMCPQSEENTMVKGIMDFDFYKAIVTEAAQNGLISLKLNIRGEPLMNPRLVDMVAHAKRRGIKEVMFNTNGLLLTPEKTRALIHAGIDYIIISIDGATKETYEAIRKGGDFETLKNNINSLIKYRKQMRLSKPLIRLQYVKMKDNEDEVAAYFDMWKNKVDVMTANDYSCRVKGDTRSVRNTKSTGRATCPHPFQRLSISWDGDVMMCCGDWNMLGILGNCKEDSLFDIWHSPEMEKRRKLLREKKLDMIPACKDCFVLSSYEWE